MSYRGKFYDDREQPRRGNIVGMIGWGFVGLACVVVLLAMGWLLLGDLQEQYTTNSIQQAVATQAPVAPTPRPIATAVPIVQPIIVQMVPAGESPQRVTITEPNTSVDATGNTESPVVQPQVVIVHQTSADNTRQSITGSGACKVSRVAARCGK
jgi:hypothetical protein